MADALFGLLPCGDITAAAWVAQAKPEFGCYGGTGSGSWCVRCGLDDHRTATIALEAQLYMCTCNAACMRGRQVYEVASKPGSLPCRALQGADMVITMLSSMQRAMSLPSTQSCHEQICYCFLGGLQESQRVPSSSGLGEILQTLQVQTLQLSNADASTGASQMNCCVRLRVLKCEHLWRTAMRIGQCAVSKCKS